MDQDKVVRAYLNIREQRAKLRREYEAADEELKGKLTKVESYLLKFLNDHDMESVKTEAGTFYRQVNTMPMGSDWGAFFEWVKENDAFEALERRIKKGFIVEYMEEHDGDLPPGVSVHRERVVRVRKGS